MSEETCTITVRLPVDLKEQLEQLAKAMARSRSWLTVDAIKAYVELQEWQIKEIEAGLREADAGDFASDEEVKTVIQRWASADDED